MPKPILATKLYIPPPRPNLIRRIRLLEGLNAGLYRKLTLISAPAGFGKTTLVSEWITSSKRPAAWLSLDEEDGDPVRFLTYLVAALRTLDLSQISSEHEEAVPQIGEGVLAHLQSPQPLPIETILTTLLNEISANEDAFILALDDYHLLEATEINDALTFLLDHLPPQMHLVITTREDPNLPLARYRVRGQLTEVRAADLRFTPDEAADFLNQAMGLSLSSEEIAALESRTEGWIAGLQMAALSMQGREDTDHFIQAFTGSHRFVLDYLAEEVLHRQPDHVRSFLVQTAILDQLSGPLCDAVTGRGDGKRMLETLEHDNLFVIPLDEQRQWYRYHHLFAEVLEAYSMDEQPEEQAILHQRASEWYEQNGQRTHAIRHALAAEDFERAADLAELTWPARHRSDFQSPDLLAWLEAIPDELIRVRPVLSVGYAWELLNGGEFAAAATRLEDAKRWVNPPNTSEPAGVRVGDPAGEMRFMDKEEFRLLPTEIASARAYLAMALGDVSGTITYAQKALDLIPKDDYIRRGPGASLLGLAYWTVGELEAGYQALAEGMVSFQKAGNILFGISGVFGLADIRIAQGRLRDAIDIYEQSLQLALKHGGRALDGTADLHLGLSELYREQGDLTMANAQLAKSQEVGEQAVQSVYLYHVCLAQARAKQEQGDLDGAILLFDEAEKLFAGVHIPDFRPAAALKVRVHLAQGRLTEALRWVKARGLSVDDNLSYLRECEHITLARVLIAQYRDEQVTDSIHQALGLLARLLNAAEKRGGMGSVIEILLLQALAYDALGNKAAALAALENALTIAEPEGYVRTFVDEGLPMASLLQAAAEEDIALGYVRHLLAAFGPEEDKATTTEQLPTAQTPTAQAPTTATVVPLIEPLSDRELDVLRLLRTELSGPEIAQELVVSLNTMRTHSKNIYSKLGVNNRRAAVRRAEELGLL